jgi:phosphohistidine phosphatase
MKQLVLVRHAQAESALPGQSDFERALTRRGVADASDMVRRLKLRSQKMDYLLSSPAHRAAATARAFAQGLRLTGEFPVFDERLYAAEDKDFLRVLQEQNQRHRGIVLVAHNPGITAFADRLSNERRIDAMPTCAVVSMQIPIDDWSELNWHLGRDVELDYPGKT